MGCTTQICPELLLAFDVHNLSQRRRHIHKLGRIGHHLSISAGQTTFFDVDEWDSGSGSASRGGGSGSSGLGMGREGAHIVDGGVDGDP